MVEAAPEAENRPEVREPHRPERERNDRGDRRRGGRGPGEERVTGMGDHVPAFLLREFRFDAGPAADDAETETEEAAAPALPATAAEPAPDSAEAPVAASEPADSVQPEPTAEVQAEPAAEPKPKPKRRRTVKSALPDAAAPAA